MDDEVSCPRCFGFGSLWRARPHPCGLCMGAQKVTQQQALEWRLGLVKTSGFDRATILRHIEEKGPLPW